MDIEKIKNKLPHSQKKERGKVYKVLRVLFVIFVMLFILLIVFRKQIQTMIDHHYDDTPFSEEAEEFYNEQLIGEEGQVEQTISETNIREVFDITGLQTANYIFNSVVRVYDEDNEDIIYYVSYEGTIVAGINFDDIDIKIDDENKKIVFTVPEVEIQDTIVDAGKLDFIFMKDKYDKEETYNEAYSLCQNDLDEKAKNETDLLSTAQENAEQVINALTSPWIEQLYPDYVIEFNEGGEE